MKKILFKEIPFYHGMAVILLAVVVSLGVVVPKAVNAFALSFGAIQVASIADCAEPLHCPNIICLGGAVVYFTPAAGSGAQGWICTQTGGMCAGGGMLVPGKQALGLFAGPYAVYCSN